MIAIILWINVSNLVFCLDQFMMVCVHQFWFNSTFPPNNFLALSVFLIYSRNFCFRCWLQHTNQKSVSTWFFFSFVSYNILLRKLSTTLACTFPRTIISFSCLVVCYGRYVYCKVIVLQSTVNTWCIWKECKQDTFIFAIMWILRILMNVSLFVFRCRKQGQLYFNWLLFFINLFVLFFFFIIYLSVTIITILNN